MGVRKALAFGLVLAGVLMTPGLASAGQKLAIFPFDLIDDTKENEYEPARPEEIERVKLATEELRKLVAADGRYEVVDMTPVAKEIEDKGPIYKCNGCEDGIAKKVGAEVALITTVQKISRVALNMNVYVRDVVNERTVRAMSTDILGNTDENWLRGVKYLTKNRLFAEEAKR